MWLCISKKVQVFIWLPTLTIDLIFFLIYCMIFVARIYQVFGCLKGCVGELNPSCVYLFQYLTLWFHRVTLRFQYRWSKWPSVFNAARNTSLTSDFEYVKILRYRACHFHCCDCFRSADVLLVIASAISLVSSDLLIAKLMLRMMRFYDWMLSQCTGLVKRS